MSERPVEAIERILGETDDADDVLRGAVAALVARPRDRVGRRQLPRRRRARARARGRRAGRGAQDARADHVPGRARRRALGGRKRRTARCSSTSPRSSHPRSSSAGTRAATRGSRRTLASSRRFECDHDPAVDCGELRSATRREADGSGSAITSPRMRIRDLREGWGGGGCPTGGGRLYRAPVRGTSARLPSPLPTLLVFTRSGDAIPRTRYPPRTRDVPRSSE